MGYYGFPNSKIITLLLQCWFHTSVAVLDLKKEDKCIFLSSFSGFVVALSNYNSSDSSELWLLGVKFRVGNTNHTCNDIPRAT